MAGFDSRRLDELLARRRGVDHRRRTFRQLGARRRRPAAAAWLPADRRRQVGGEPGGWRDSAGTCASRWASKRSKSARCSRPRLQIRRLLADNRIVAMLLDRHIGRDRVDVTFFGRRTGFLRTPAMIGYLSGAPLLPAFMIRQADDRFVGVLGDPIVVDSVETARRQRARRDAGVRRPARGPDSRESAALVSVLSVLAQARHRIAHIELQLALAAARRLPSASVTLPTATRTPSASTSPSILIMPPIRPTTRARASSS